MTDHERAQRLAEIRARAEKATPGPWQSMRYGNSCLENGQHVGQSVVVNLPRPWNSTWVGWGFERNQYKTFLQDKDADFVSHARADVPFLLAEIDRLSAAPAPVAFRRVTAVGWYCSCGHPNGINLAECACCSRRPGGPENPIETIYAPDAAPVQATATDYRTNLCACGHPRYAHVGPNAECVACMCGRAPVQETAAPEPSCPTCGLTQSVIETKGHGPACWGTPEELAPRAVCLDCGLPYEEFGGLDILLPRSQWLVIHPDENGLLCAMCIVRRAAKIPECSAIQATLEILPRRQLDVVGRPDPATPRSQGTELRGGPDADPVCQHGTALDVHCCNCHSGFVFDKNHECPPAAPDLRAQIEALLPDLIDVLRHVNVLDCGAHYCRYCPAKSPDWDHTPGCPYVESQHANNRARAMRTTLADLLPAPEKETR